MKTIEFLCSHINIKVEKSNIFCISSFIISRKVRIQLKCKVRFVQCMEKVLRLTEVSKWLAKFCAGDFSLDRFCHGWKRTVEVDSSQTETLTEKNPSNVIPCRTWPTYSKYPNWLLNTICTSLVMWIVLMFGFDISEAKKKPSWPYFHR